MLCNLLVTPAASWFSTAGCHHLAGASWYSTSWSGHPRWPCCQLASDSGLGLPCWHRLIHQLVPDLNSRTPTLVLAIYQLVPDPNGRIPTLVYKFGDLDHTLIQLSSPAAVNNPDYAQNTLTLHNKCEYVAI